MLAEIELFIKENYNPEVIGLFVRSFDAFDALYEDVDYNQPYVAILMDSNNDESADVADLLYARLRNDVRELISQFEIKFTEDIEFSKLLSILEGLIALPDYQDKDTVANIIETGDTSVDIFAELIELVTQLQSIEVIQVVEFVPSELFTKLMENLDPDNDLSDADPAPINPKLIDKLKAYREYTPNKNNFGFKLIEGGYSPGGTFKHYQNASGTMLDAVEDIDTVADELLTLMYISSDAYENPLQFYTDNSSTIFSDEKRITKVYVKIKNRIAEFEAYYTNKQVSNKGIANAQTRPL